MERNIRLPSSLPSRGSQLRSGWGIIPSTLPRSLMMPAMLRAEPLGLEPLVILPASSQYRKITCPLLSSRSEGFGVGVIVALAVGNGDAKSLTHAAPGGEGGVGPFGSQVCPLAPVFQVRIAHQDAGQQTGFAQHLEAVADADNQPSFGGVPVKRGHDRGKAGYGPGPQVVAIGETAGEDNAIKSVKALFPVPDVIGFLAQDVFDLVVAVGIAPGAGEYQDAKTHNARPGLRSCGKLLW